MNWLILDSTFKIKRLISSSYTNPAEINVDNYQIA